MRSKRAVGGQAADLIEKSSSRYSMCRFICLFNGSMSMRKGKGPRCRPDILACREHVDDCPYRYPIISLAKEVITERILATVRLPCRG